MIEQRFRQRTEEEGREYLAKWESLFLGMLAAYTKTGRSFYDLEPLIEFVGPEGKFTVAPIAYLINKDINPRIITVDIYRDGEVIQRAMALATWENGRPTVRREDIDQRTTLGYEQYNFDQFIDLAARALNNPEIPDSSPSN
ncbi:MAG: hypothetical protein A3B38_01345 [Candidatus Levybacteria bacterium RIFCSPLOWO2_01_FULL_36_13]|nr:MAG: hypothetical protein A2684_02580 [Candidatus Levybacteria bacterium RIFCSPHIGHO2_01_FULL_36_15b]OGH35522.1 MAG: hypothetical protein A3B38_01345 [Candidatus Levybacteria bacterium RIFCSPLOWO2_01_FULL_36_13]